MSRLIPSRGDLSMCATPGVLPLRRMHGGDPQPHPGCCWAFRVSEGEQGPLVQAPLRRLGKLFEDLSHSMKASWKGFCCELSRFLKVPGFLQVFMNLHVVGPCHNMFR